MATDEVIEAEVREAEATVAAEPKPAPLVVTGNPDLPTLGKLLVASGFFKGDTTAASQAIVKVMAGRGLGIGPIAAMSNLFVMQGRLSMSYALIAALVKRSGIYDYRVKEIDRTHCTLTFRQKVDGEWEEVGESTFTIEDAQLAGLQQRSAAWKQYPRNLLFARALTNGVRWYCPDIFMGNVYNEDELE